MLNKNNKRRLFQGAIFSGVLSALMSVSFFVQAQNVQTVKPESKQLARYETQADVETSTELAPQDAEGFFEQKGIATWYGPQFHGRLTASGERYDMHAYTAAHKTLPFGSIVKVVNAETGEAVLVEVTDRGPYVRNRIIDLSYTASREVGVTNAPVEIEAYNPVEFATANPEEALAFTSDYEAVSVPRNGFEAIESFDDFSAAIRRMKMIQEESGDEDLLLVAAPAVRVAQTIALKKKAQTKTTYYVGTIRQQQQQTPTIIKVAHVQ